MVSDLKIRYLKKGLKMIYSIDARRISKRKFASTYPYYE
jgi:hypothetical protein